MAVVAQTLAFEIEGLGTWTSNGLPLRFTETELRTHAGVAQYVPLLKTWPATLSNRIDPLEGWMTQGTISFEIAADDLDTVWGDRVRQFLTTVRPEPAALLAADIAAGAAQIDAIQIPGADEVVAGDVIFLRREAMYVSSVSAGGGVGGSDRLSVVRGQYGTTAKAHKAGSFDDTEIYIASSDNGSGNPVVESRRVSLYRYTPGGSASRFRVYYLDSVDEDGGILRINARDVWSWVNGRKLGQGAVVTKGIIFYLAADLNNRRVGVAEDGGTLVVEAPPLIGGTHMVVTDGEAIAPVEASVDTAGQVPRVVFDTIGTGDASGYPLLYRTNAQYRNGEDPLLAEDTLREVLVSWKDATYSHFADSAGNHSSHPFDIVRCLLCSTGEATWTSGGGRTVGSNGDYDWLPRWWGMGVDDELIDHTGIDDLKARYPYAGLKMESLIIGAEGEEDAQEVLAAIFKATGTFPALSSTGLITIKDLRDPGPVGADATVGVNQVVRPEGEGSPIKWRRRGFPIVRDLIVEVGRVGFEEDPVTRYTQVNFQGVQTDRHPQTARDVTINARSFGTPEGVVPLEGDQLKAIFSWRWQLQKDPLPECDLEVPADLPSLPAGSIISLTAPGVMDRDGTRGITSHRCLILDSALDGNTFGQRLRALDLQPITRSEELLSPGWEIDTVAGDDEFDLVADRFTPDDLAKWIDGAQVILLDANGVLRSTDGPSFGTLSGSTVSLDQQWQASSVNITPATGDIIVFAHYDDRGSSGEEAYAWIADSGGKLGTADDPAHRWGF